MSKSLAAAQPKPVKKRYAQRKKTLLLLSMASPGIIWFLLLRYLPMFGVILAFKEFRIKRGQNLFQNILSSEWAGLSKFKFLFSTSDSWNMIKNTVGYNALWIVLTLVISVAFAVMLNEVTKKFVAKSYQTLMFFPYFLSWVVVSYFVLAFLEPTRGLITNWQINAGMEPTNWYYNAKPWPFILTFANLWKNIGYSTILYLAAITGIDASQYEAASIDGASKWQQVLYVTLPHLKTMIVILFIMNVGKIFNADFGLFFTVTQNSGPLYPKTMVIDLYVYNALIATQDVAMSTAAGLLQNIVGFICIMTANTIVRKVDEDSSLF